VFGCRVGCPGWTELAKEAPGFRSYRAPTPATLPGFTHPPAHLCISFRAERPALIATAAQRRQFNCCFLPPRKFWAFHGTRMKLYSKRPVDTGGDVSRNEAHRVFENQPAKAKQCLGCSKKIR